MRYALEIIVLALLVAGIIMNTVAIKSLEEYVINGLAVQVELHRVEHGHEG